MSNPVTPHTNSSSIEDVIEYLKAHSYVLTLAESCTAGEVSSLIADVSGCGSVLFNGYVVYSEIAKQECLGVNKSTIDKFGLTSEEVAREMAVGALENHPEGEGRPNVAIAITGKAESDDDEDGVVCFAYASRSKGQITVASETVHFDGERNEVRSMAARHAILSLPDYCGKLCQV